MIRKLRFKFILVNMSIVTLMLAVILGLVFYFTRANLEAESIRMMQGIAAQPFQLGVPDELGEDVRLPFFTIQLGPGGELAATGGGYYDLSDGAFLRSLIQTAYSSPKRLGVIEEYNLRYYRSDSPINPCLVFSDMSSERATLNSLVKTCLLIGGLGFLLFLGISILLSRWAVRPVEQAWKQQRQFVADASHELKTPLTVIMTNAELAQSPDYDEAGRQRFLSSILTMSRQMRGLIEEMLQLARADQADTKATFAPVNFSKLISDALLPFEPIFFEAELPETFSDQMEKENMELHTFSLLTEDAIPEDADCVMIYSPATDISQEEKDMLADYAANGGKLLVMAGPAEEDDLENLYSLLSDYGVTANEGIVIEGDREHYAFQSPFALMPDMASSDITDSLIEENYYPIMPISRGLTVTDDTSVTALLTTSDAAFSKIAGFEMTTYEKEDGDVDGPFALAVSIDCGNSGQIIWFASSSFLDDVYNAYSSGANVNLGMNALSAMIGESEAMAIRSKSLNYNYLTISESTSSLLKTMMIGVFPLLYLGVGIGVVLVRRRRQNEAV